MAKDKTYMKMNTIFKEYGHWYDFDRYKEKGYNHVDPSPPIYYLNKYGNKYNLKEIEEFVTYDWKDAKWAAEVKEYLNTKLIELWKD